MGKRHPRNVLALRCPYRAHATAFPLPPGLAPRTTIEHSFIFLRSRIPDRPPIPRPVHPSTLPYMTNDASQGNFAYSNPTTNSFRLIGYGKTSGATVRPIITVP